MSEAADEARPVDVAVLGAGPVGLEAAAALQASGYTVTLLEAREPGAHVEAWGHVRLFTPSGMNVGPAGRRLLEEAGRRLPDPGVHLSGHEFREAYLLPLAEALRTAAGVSLRTGARVVSVGRGRLLKTERPGAPERSDDPFRVLVEGAGGEERTLRAHRVLDATGTYGRPNWAGPGGVPALGERVLRDEVEYGLPDVEGARREAYTGGTTLLLGGGHSAATTALALAQLAAEVPGTRFVWATRTADAAPLACVPDDPLPARDDLCARANALAADPPAGSAWWGGAVLQAIAGDPGGRFRATLRRPDGPHEIEVDRVVANVGYEPDDGLYRQLQVHECYASRGPMKLSAALLAASGEGAADCLELGGFGPEALRNPEPGFFIVGMKSYGKNGAFLLRTGYEQVTDVLELLRAEGSGAAGAG